MKRAIRKLSPITAVLLLTLLLPARPLNAQPVAEPAAPAWLEPHGLSIVDMVGFVPESYLQGAIISWDATRGIVRYVSGSRQGNTVRIHVAISPYVVPGNYTQMGCLAQTLYFDTWGTVSPASRIWLYENGSNITSSIAWYYLESAGQIQPSGNTSGGRYPRTNALYPSGLVGGGMSLPANRGCEMIVRGSRAGLEADFEIVDQPAQAQVSVVGQQTLTFHSYVGGGNMGWLEPFAAQMRGRFGDRHEKPGLSIPAGADYVFVNFPPMPVAPYSDSATGPNAVRPSSGTYRLMGAGGQLSVDHQVAMGIPWRGQWRDADHSGGSAFLPYFREGVSLAAPEYILPPGSTYNPCMAAGNCSDAILQSVYDATYQVKVYYLRVDRTDPTLARVRLCQVGPSWQEGGNCAAGEASQVGASEAAAAVIPAALVPRMRLPLVVKQPPPPPPPPPPEDPTGCPCGWFAPDGRMIDFTPPQ